jgi:hypothetical protein
MPDASGIAAASMTNAGFGLSDGTVPLEFEGNLLLIDEARDRLLAYNSTALVVHSLLTKGLGLKAAAAELAALFDLSAEEAQRDIKHLVDHWTTEGLLANEPSVTNVPPVFTGPRAASVSKSASQLTRWTCKIGALGIAFSHDGIGAHSLRTFLAQFETEPGTEHLAMEVRVVDNESARLLIDGHETLVTQDPGLLMGCIFQHLLERLHPGTDWLAIVHAAAVGRAGKAVGLPGSSGSGKSTLAAALTTQGFDYLTDDLLAIAAPRGDAVPWPMPMSVKRGSWHVLAPYFPALDEAPAYRTKGLDARLLKAPEGAWELPPAPLSALVFPTYEVGAPTRLIRLTPIDTLVKLLSDRVWLGQPLEERAVQRFLEWLRRVPAYSLGYSSMDEAINAVHSIINE